MYRQSSNSLSWLSVSTLAHAGAMVGMLALPFGSLQTGLLSASTPSDTQDVTTIEFQPMEVVQSPSAPEIQAPPPVAPPPKPKKVTKAKAKPKHQHQPKVEAAASVNEPPVRPVTVEPESETRPEPTPVEDRAPIAMTDENLDAHTNVDSSETPITNEVADTSDDIINEKVATDEVIEVVNDDASATVLTEEPFEAQPAPQPVPAEAHTPPITASPTASAQAASSAPQRGVPIRSYLDLRQVPGNQPPSYPPLARRQAREGKVDLLYFVNQQGQVERIQVMRSSGHPDLDQEAVQSVAKFRYIPGQAGWTNHPVHFALRGPAQPQPVQLRTHSP